MSKACNLSKLRTVQTSSSPQNRKQTTISKFFQPKNNLKKESAFDELLAPAEIHSKEQCVKNSGKRVASKLKHADDTSAVTAKKPKTEKSCQKISSATLEKLNSFSSLSSSSNVQIEKLQLRNITCTDLEKNGSENSDGDDEKMLDEIDSKPRKRSKVSGNKNKESSSVGSKSTYTPLEKQFLKIKETHKDAILFVECGYKYRFFGEDAEIAAKELNIICHLDHNFQTASIPTHRLFVHVRRLVAKGYKVGVVKQMETAALKATSENRNAPFERQLTALYTKATLIEDDMISAQNSDALMETTLEWEQNQCLVILCEHHSGLFNANVDKISLGLIAMYPATGKMKYDYFETSSTRQDLDARLTQLQPTEILLPLKNVTRNTEKLVEYWSTKNVTSDDRLRLERLDDDVFDYSASLVVVTSFYETQSDADVKEDNLKMVLDLPHPVISCLAALITYLKEFKLERILLLASQFASKLSPEKKYLNLDASTIRNLEIFFNLMDGKTVGSLFWVLNNTLTKFGSRLLRNWIMQPLTDVKAIEERQEAITELLTSNDALWIDIKAVFQKLPDMEKILGAVFHYKCSTATFYSLIDGFSSVGNKFKSLSIQFNSEISSQYVLNLISSTVSCLYDVDDFLKNINMKAAKEGDKTKIFYDWSSFPDVVKRFSEIKNIMEKLKNLKKPIRDTLRLPAFDYTTVSGQEYLIEVRNAQLKAVPKDWITVSSTKQFVRFRSPEVEDLLKQLNQLREHLSSDCAKAWKLFLEKFNKCFYRYSQAVENLATLDCLFSLVKVASQPGYCRPFMVEHSQVIHIEGGCHPIISLLMSEDKQFVPNNTELDENETRCMIITGPNMGGKSSYIRQVGLIAIMAHIGSYVPAEAATIGTLDGIYTRMGSSDDLIKGYSTFMVEMQDTSYIIQKATSKSLVILDELGRGTSTHDGVAIAEATLKYFLTEVKCLTMFVTHYTILTELNCYSDHAANYHMSFIVNESENESTDEDLSWLESVIFMYQLTHGKAGRSYGLNVARLADLHVDILKTAKTKSLQMEESIQTKRKFYLFKKLWKCSEDDVHSILLQLKDK